MLANVVAYYGYGYGYGLGGFYFDPTMILVLIGAVISMIASACVKSTFNKYAKVRSCNGMTGAQVAEMMLRNAGIHDVRVQHVSGELTDHYDPRKKVVSLSDSVYSSSSVAAIGVAAHECGHVMQHYQGYMPIKLRTALVPIVNLGTKLSWPLLVFGVLLGGMIGYGVSGLLIDLGIILFSTGLIFQVVTLPVEFNASSRALRTLEGSMVLMDSELKDAKKVLSAAAFTYVAAVAASLLSLLRIILIYGGRRRD